MSKIKIFTAVCALTLAITACTSKSSEDTTEELEITTDSLTVSPIDLDDQVIIPAEIEDVDSANLVP